MGVDVHGITMTPLDFGGHRVIIELGNHSAHRGIDDAPKVTQLHIPDFDDGSTHPDAQYEGGRHPCADEFDDDGQLVEVGELVKAGPQLGGYTHEPGAITVADFKAHVADSLLSRNGITQLPGHEALLAVVSAWPSQGSDKPRWVNVIPGENTPGGHADDIQEFLTEFYGCKKEKPGNVEDMYWTRFGPPGQGGPALPPLTNGFTNDGRAQQAVNYGGGQVGTTGAATATTSTSLTNSGASWTVNAWANYRVYAQSSTSNMVWANVLSNTATALTVDRWYAAATPGGSAGSTPSSTTPYMIADGGVVSGWFVALTTTNITPAATDHNLSGEYTTASGGYLRKIAPYALTSGTSPMTYTLTPVYTGNGSDTYPSTFYAIGVFLGMVVTASSPYTPMKFDTSLNASATVAASGDQITVTETVTGS